MTFPTRRFSLAAVAMVFAVATPASHAAAAAGPALAFATYLRPLAIEPSFQNHGLAVTADADGNVYVAGVTDSASFPATAGAFRTTRPGKYDVFVAKVKADGSALVWATYLGGSNNEVENLESIDIALDKDRNVYVTGATASADFPTTPGAYQTTLLGSADAFVTKIKADGSGLVYSTYLGGTGLEYGWGIAVNADGEAFVCGETNGGFPTTGGAYQTQSQSGSAFLTKLSADGAGLLFSTTLGTNTGKARDVAIDKNGNAFVTGSADSPHGGTSYPVTAGAYQTDAGGSFEAFVTKVNPSGTGLVYSTYLGGSGNEDGRGIAIDIAGNAYVTGTTTSANFPATAGAFQTAFASTPIPVEDAFVAKLSTSGSALVYATYLGGAGGESAGRIAVDGAGAAIVTGGTGSSNFPTTAGAFQETFDYNPQNPTGSAWVTRVAANGKTLAYSTFLHPTDLTQFDIAYAVAVDAKGGLYVTGTSGATFPTTAGAFQTTGVIAAFGGPFVAKLSGVAAGAAPAVCGDFNGDGRITTGDALGTLRVTVGLGTCPITTCDYNGDAKISITDALITLRVAVGLPGTAKCPAA